MATLKQKIAAEQKVRELLVGSDVPFPDEIEYGHTCIRLVWLEPKVVLVVDIDEPPEDLDALGWDGLAAGAEMLGWDGLADGAEMLAGDNLSEVELDDEQASGDCDAPAGGSKTDGPIAPGRRPASADSGDPAGGAETESARGGDARR